MSQSQGIEVRRVSRRTIASGAAWAVPVIAVGAAAPHASASGTPCVPSFIVDIDKSFKCCDGGRLKNMKLVIDIVDENNCLATGTAICITDIRLGNGQPIGTLSPTPPICGAVDGEVTVYLLNVQSCTVNLDVYYTVAGDGTVRKTALKSGNIPSGNSDAACVP